MKEYETLTDFLRAFILEQPMFCVGTAPLSADGRVNVSPKGLDGFFKFITLAAYESATGVKASTNSKCIVAFVDVGGSGIETCAHLTENGRVTFMFNAFKGAPKIVRLFGEGRYYVPNDGKPFDELLRCFDEQKLLDMYKSKENFNKIRGICVADIDRIRDSCGYGVPLMDFVGHRTIFNERLQLESAEQIVARRKENNVRSIDGLPGSRTYSDEAYDDVPPPTSQFTPEAMISAVLSSVTPTKKKSTTNNTDPSSSSSSSSTSSSTSTSSTSSKTPRKSNPRLVAAIEQKISSLQRAGVPETDQELTKLLQDEDVEEIIEHEVNSRRESRLIANDDGAYKLPPPTMNNVSIAVASLLTGITIGYFLKR